MELTFADLLTVHRRRKGYGIGRLAGLAEVDRRTLHRYERGGIPSPEAVSRLAQALDLDGEDFERFYQAARAVAYPAPDKNEAADLSFNFLQALERESVPDVPVPDEPVPDYAGEAGVVWKLRLLSGELSGHDPGSEAARTIRREIGETVRAWRHRLRLEPFEFGQLLGFAVSSVAQAENGDLPCGFVPAVERYLAGAT